MFSVTARASRPLVARFTAAQSRTFMVTASRRADIVQDLYLRELKNYKPSAVKENDHEGQVKSWSQPSAPKVPDLGTSSADSDLKAYETQSVEVEGQSSEVGGATTTAASSIDNWFEEDLVFEGEEEGAGGH